MQLIHQFVNRVHELENTAKGYMICERIMQALFLCLVAIEDRAAPSPVAGFWRNMSRSSSEPVSNDTDAPLPVTSLFPKHMSQSSITPRQGPSARSKSYPANYGDLQVGKQGGHK